MCSSNTVSIERVQRETSSGPRFTEDTECSVQVILNPVDLQRVNTDVETKAITVNHNIPILTPYRPCLSHNARLI